MAEVAFCRLELKFSSRLRRKRRVRSIPVWWTELWKVSPVVVSVLGDGGTKVWLRTAAARQVEEELKKLGEKRKEKKKVQTDQKCWTFCLPCLCEFCTRFAFAGVMTIVIVCEAWEERGERSGGLPVSLSTYYQSGWEIWSTFLSGCPPGLHITSVTFIHDCSMATDVSRATLRDGGGKKFISGCVAPGRGNKKNQRRIEALRLTAADFTWLPLLLSVRRTLVSLTKMELFQRCMLAGVSFTRALRMSLLLPVSTQSNHKMSEGLKRFFRSQSDGAELTNEGIGVIYLPFYNTGLHKGTQAAAFSWHAHPTQTHTFYIYSRQWIFTHCANYTVRQCSVWSYHCNLEHTAHKFRLCWRRHRLMGVPLILQVFGHRLIKLMESRWRLCERSEDSKSYYKSRWGGSFSWCPTV